MTAHARPSCGLWRLRASRRSSCLGLGGLSIGRIACAISHSEPSEMRNMTSHQGEDISYPGGTLRLYVEAALAEDGRVEPSEGQIHYLLHVMRAKAGDKVR